MLLLKSAHKTFFFQCLKNTVLALLNMKVIPNIGIDFVSPVSLEADLLDLRYLSSGNHGLPGN